MDDCVGYARAVGERIGEELGIPVWLYEYAASRPERRNLADAARRRVRGAAQQAGHGASGRRTSARTPGMSTSRSTGVCTVGARKFLIAYNINFNTRNHRLVNDIALDIREKGRIARDARGQASCATRTGNPVYTARHVRQVQGDGLVHPGSTTARS